LDIEQKAIFGQKKPALNKTNISLARVNIFCPTGTATILTNVLNLSLWTGAFYSAYLPGMSIHRRSTTTSEWVAAVQVISKSVRPQQQLFA